MTKSQRVNFAFAIAGALVVGFMAGAVSFAYAIAPHCP